MQFSNSTAGYLPKEKENINSKKYVHPHVDSSIVDTKIWDKNNALWQMISVYIYTMEYYSGTENEMLPFAAMWLEPRGYYD